MHDHRTSRNVDCGRPSVHLVVHVAGRLRHRLGLLAAYLVLGAASCGFVVSRAAAEWSVTDTDTLNRIENNTDIVPLTLPAIRDGIVGLGTRLNYMFEGTGSDYGYDHFLGYYRGMNKSVQSRHDVISPDAYVFGGYDSQENRFRETFSLRDWYEKTYETGLGGGASVWTRDDIDAIVFQLDEPAGDVNNKYAPLTENVAETRYLIDRFGDMFFRPLGGSAWHNGTGSNRWPYLDEYLTTFTTETAVNMDLNLQELRDHFLDAEDDSTELTPDVAYESDPLPDLSTPQDPLPFEPDTDEDWTLASLLPDTPVWDPEIDDTVSSPTTPPDWTFTIPFDQVQILGASASSMTFTPDFSWYADVRQNVHTIILAVVGALLSLKVINELLPGSSGEGTR